MVKEMKFEWKQSHILCKVAVSILLLGLTFRLLYPHSTGFVPNVEQKEKPLANYTLSSTYALPLSVVPAPTQNFSENVELSDQNAQKVADKCDLFVGDWIPNPVGPAYTNESCRVIQDHQNCMRNGRPDSGYLYWRWKPRDCELPRFDPFWFLESMRNKSWAFVGDSISRNHLQSMLCFLSKVEEGTEVYHDETYQSNRWHFPSYNFTLSVVWSPFLVNASSTEVSTSEVELHLDEVDSTWADQYHNFDYLVISGGKWFLKTAIYYENKTITGCHYCQGKNNLTELGFDYAYHKALQTVLNFITSSNHDATILFRSATPDHFEDGQWFSGGSCRRMVPFKEGKVGLSDIDAMLRDVEVEEYKKAAEIGSQRGVNIKFLDTSQMSLLRPDGHPGPYRFFQPFAKDHNATVQNDCLHWCLPGPIDSWNDLVMQMVMNL